MATSPSPAARSRSVDAVTALLRPKSIAIVGMSAKEGSAGRTVLDGLRNNDYPGAIYLVGRSAGEVEGRQIVTDINAIPEGVDLAVLVLPAAGVREAIEGCVRRKVKTAVVFASGFAETGDDARGEQERIGKIARDGGLSVVGPNCLGYANYADRIAVGFASGNAIPKLPAGTTKSIAIVSQSGGLGGHLTQAFAARRIPVSYWISTGNEMDLGLPDFVRFLIEDPATSVITVYAEDVRDPEAFLAAAAEARKRNKPIVMLHPGRGAKAQEAAKSHTGALAGNYAVMQMRVRDAGVVLVDTMDEMTDVSEILAHYPEPSQGGLGVLTFSGAFCGIVHDFCEDIGIDVPPLTPETEAHLKPQVPVFLPPKNPLDLGTQPIWQPELVEIGSKALMADPRMAALAISIPAGSPRHALAYVKGIAAARRASKKPLVLAILGDASPLTKEFLEVIEADNIILSRSSDRILRAIGHVIAYGNFNAGRGTTPALPAGGLPALGKGPQSEWLGKSVFAALGVKVPQGALAKSADEAVAVATRIGFPVAMKAQAAQLAHKTEAGGVLLNVRDADGVRAAWATLVANVAKAAPGLALEGVLVETMSPKGLELVVGARRDPKWGPVVLVGLGGIWVEALNDVRLLPPDASKERVIAELGKLKTAKLLQGFRNTPPSDVEAVADVVRAVGALMLAKPEIVEIDVNPLMVHAKGQGATALDALIVTQG